MTGQPPPLASMLRSLEEQERGRGLEIRLYAPDRPRGITVARIRVGMYREHLVARRGQSTLRVLAQALEHALEEGPERDVPGPIEAEVDALDRTEWGTPREALG